MKRITKNTKGFALLMAIVIAGLVVTIGAGIASLATRQIALSTDTRESTFAFYAANTGVECAKRAYAVSNSFEVVGPSFIVCNGEFVEVAHVGSTYSFNFGYAPNQPQVKVTVERNSDGTFTVLSRGYNTDSTNSARKVERKVQAILPTKGVCTTPGDVMLVLDISGSFVQSELDIVQDAAKLVVSRLSGSTLTENEIDDLSSPELNTISEDPDSELMHAGLVYFGAGAKAFSRSPGVHLDGNLRELASHLESASTELFDFWVGSSTGHPNSPPAYTTYEAPFMSHLTASATPMIHGGHRNGTNVAAALLEAAKILETEGRPDVPHSIVLLTDGESNRSCGHNFAGGSSLSGMSCLGYRGNYACDHGPFNPVCPSRDSTSYQFEAAAGQAETVPFADYLRSQFGVKIFVMGIDDGSNIFPSTMIGIAGGDENYFPVTSNMDDIYSIIKDHLTRECVPPPVRHRVNVTLSGATGSSNVTSDPAAINCGNGQLVCSSEFTSGGQVVLTAHPASGQTVSWTGECNTPQTGNTCIALMNETRDVVATFNNPEQPPPQPPCQNGNCPPPDPCINNPNASVCHNEQIDIECPFPGACGPIQP